MKSLRHLFTTALLAVSLTGLGSVLAQEAPPAPKPPGEPAVEAAIEKAVEQVEKAIEQVDAQVRAAKDAAAQLQAADITWGERPKQTGREVIKTGQSATVKAGEVVPQVVVTQGSATIDGEVTGDVVVILGKARINGRVWGNVVNVGEGIVLGPEARVRGDAVGVLGGIFMGTNSFIGGDAVGVIGGITKEDGARVRGEEVPVAIGNWVGADGFKLPEWIKTSFYELVLKARPLSFAVGWVWVVWAVFLGVYLMFGLLFPGACNSVAATIGDRALTSFFVGLLMIPLIPLITLILTLTGVGLVVVPFLGAAVFLATLLGKAALLLYLGNTLGRQFKTQFPPLVAILVGAIPLTILYLVPFLGFIMLKVTDLWALGAATVALFAGFRSERPAPPASPVQPASPVAPMAPQASVFSSGVPLNVVTEPAPAQTIPVEPVMAFAATGAAAVASEPAPSSTAVGFTPAPMPAAPQTPVVPEALTLPRVGFKDRFWATCLDWLILCMVCGPLGVMGYFWLLFPIYFAGMWFWKQTTVGGIVLRLKVVRLDGRRLDWPTAIVRAVGALFGSMAAGLGYFWSGWDSEKQGWHDKIAGTVVVKVPNTQPLV